MSNNNGKLKKAESKIGEYREIFNMLPIGIYRSSIDEGMFLKANPACVKILGYDDWQDLIGTKCTYYDPRDREGLLADLSIVETVENREIKLIRKNGSVVWVSITARLHDKGFIEGSLIDISNRKKIEEELDKFKENEIQSLKMICEAANSRCCL